MTCGAPALAAGTLLVTPYLFLYDLMVLAIPIAILGGLVWRTASAPMNCLRSGWLPRC